MKNSKPTIILVTVNKHKINSVKEILMEFVEMKNIKFYSNLKDDLHCVQACLRMILSYLGKDYNFKQLDRITGFKKGMWTWSTKMLIWLASKFEVIHFEDFDYKKFAEQGEDYLKRFWVRDFFRAQKAHSDFKVEQRLAEKLLKSPVKLIKNDGTLRDIERYFDDYLIMVTVNSYALDRRKGYCNHLVLITDIDKKQVIFHDPGLPPRKNRRVSRKLFMKAMYGNGTQMSLVKIN